MSNDLIIIQARLGSTRLPNKVLKRVPDNGELTLLEFMYDRIRHQIKIPVIFAIPSASSDDKLAELLKARRIPFYRGPENDLISRYVIGAERYEAETIVRLTADCPLVDPILINDMLNHFKVSEIDYLGNTTPLDASTFPDGSDIEIFTKNALRRANFFVTDARSREHVTFQFWDAKSDYINQTYQQKQSYSHLRYTIDNPEDILVFNRIYENLIKGKSAFVGYSEIQKFLDDNKAITDINKQYRPGDNW